MYQLLLWDFENFGVVEINPPLSIKELALVGLDSEKCGWTEEDGPKSELANRISEVLVEKAPLLKEYYGLLINKDTGCLEALPLLIGTRSYHNIIL